jgi:hypothetical protein
VFHRHGEARTRSAFATDCRRSPEDLRQAVEDGEGWREAMTASLAKLELLASFAARAA